MFLNIQALIEASFAGNLSWIKSYIIQRTFAHVMALMSLPFFSPSTLTSVLTFLTFFHRPRDQRSPHFYEWAPKLVLNTEELSVKQV